MTQDELVQTKKTLQSYYYAEKFLSAREKLVTYIIVSASVFFCVFGAVLGLIGSSTSNAFILVSDEIYKTIEFLKRANSIIAAAFVVFKIYADLLTDNISIDKVNCNEVFDCTLYGMELNKLIIRPIPLPFVKEWQRKIKKQSSITKLVDTLDFPTNTAIFESQKAYVDKCYGLLSYARVKFFNYIWVITFILIFVSCFFLGEKSFLEVVTSIIIPSLSIVTIISSSFYHFVKAKNILSYALNTMEEMSKQTKNKTQADLRNLQDFIFSLRRIYPVIPGFIEHFYNKKLLKEKLKQESFDKMFLESVSKKNNKNTAIQQTISINDDTKGDKKIKAEKQKNKN